MIGNARKAPGIFESKRSRAMNIAEIYESHYLPEKSKKRRP